MWTLFREISLRHLRRSPFRTALVVFGISLGVCMLCAVLAANASLAAAFEDMVGRVAGKSDLTIAGSDAGIPSSLTGEIADLEGVAHATAVVEVVTRTPDGRGGSLLVLGVDFLGDPFFLPFVQPGKAQVVSDPLAFANDPTAILVSMKLARERSLKVGSPFSLVTPDGSKKFFVRGLVEDAGPAASFGGQVVVMFIDAAQVSFSRGYMVDRIDVVIEEGADTSEVRARIAKVVKGRAQVEAPAGRAQRLVASLWAFKNGLTMSGLVSLWVGMFLIYNAVSVSVAQRRREVGILRALGVTQGQMVSLFCLEALAMAAFGTALGLLLAQQLANLALSSVALTVDRFVMPIQPPVPRITLQIALFGLVAGTTTTLLAAYLPARHANEIDPAEALRASRSMVPSGSESHAKLAWIGLFTMFCAWLLARRGGELSGYAASLLLVAGLSALVPLAVRAMRFGLAGVVERLFGVPGRIALDNVERSLGRSAITVVALMLAVAMSMSVGAYARSFERSVTQWADDAFPADAQITAGSPLLDRHHVPFGSGVIEKLQGIPGVTGINPERIVFHDLNGRRAQLASIDTQLYFTQSRRKGRSRRVLDGPAQIGITALTDGKRVLISENMANIHRLGAGDKVTLDTPSGAQTFEVHAVVVDYSYDQGWMLMDRKWYRSLWHDDKVDGIDLFFRDELEREQIVHAVRERLGATENLFVTSHAALRRELSSVAKGVFAYAKAPELITLLVAIMGVIGTMLAAVIDRIREIGMLRAIGATRGQIVISLVAEAGFLGLAAAICGIVAGTLQGYIFVKVIGTAASGWNLSYAFPTGTAVRMAIFVVGAAAITGFLPGRRASGMDIQEALAYE